MSSSKASVLGKVEEMMEDCGEDDTLAGLINMLCNLMEYRFTILRSMPPPLY